MRHLRVRGRIRGWIALVAILLGSLAPTLSQALASGALGGICSVQAADNGPAGGALGRGERPTPAHLFEHCAYCSLQATQAVLPPALSALVLLALALALAPLPLALARAHKAVYRPLSRGPPTAG